MKDQQSCVSVFVAYLTIQVAAKRISTDMTTAFHAWLYGRFIEIQSNLSRKKPHRVNQGSNFLGGSFRSRENVTVPIQFRRESQSQHPFFSCLFFVFWNISTVLI